MMNEMKNCLLYPVFPCFFIFFRKKVLFDVVFSILARQTGKNI